MNFASGHIRRHDSPCLLLLKVIESERSGWNYSHRAWDAEIFAVSVSDLLSFSFGGSINLFLLPKGTESKRPDGIHAFVPHGSEAELPFPWQ